MSGTLYADAKALVCDTFEIEEHELGDDTDFVDQLGIDSILVAELKTRFEEKYGIKIPKEELPGLSTLGNIVTYLQAQRVA